MKINTYLDGGTLVVEPHMNRLDMQSVPIFKESASRSLTPGGKVILDLKAVEFIDSAGLGALLSLRRRTSELEGNIVLANASEQTLAMFRLMKMNRIFDIFSTKEEALAALQD